MRKGSFAAIGPDALNMDKLRIGGLRPSIQIVMGYEVNFDEFTIALPGEEITGDRILRNPHAYIPGDK